MTESSMTDQVVWRPGGARIVAAAVACALIAMAVVITVKMPSDIIFMPSQLATLVPVALGTLVGLFAIARSKVTANAEGIEVLNGFKRHTLAWSQIRGFSMTPGAPWPTAVTCDDERVNLFAIQGSDGPVSSRALQQLTARLNFYRQL